MAEITEKLLQLQDPLDGRSVVHDVLRTAMVYSGSRIADGPDLVVGYDAFYGNSDASTLGEIKEPQVENNTSRWSGNHLMSPAVVPGVLLTNKKIGGSGYDLTDLTATLLAHYGLAQTKEMVGEPIPMD